MTACRAAHGATHTQPEGMVSTLEAMLVPVDGPLQEIESLAGGLEQLQRYVGGCIEAVPLPAFIGEAVADAATSYVNEEGKLVGLPFNSRATDFMVPGAGIMFGDYMAGDWLVCGFDPATGDHVELPGKVVDRLRLIDREFGGGRVA